MPRKALPKASTLEQLPAYRELRRNVRQTVRLIDRLHRQYDSKPTSGSTAAAELLGQTALSQEWGKEPVRLTYLLAEKLRLAARDCLSSLDGLLTKPSHPFPSLATARMSVELCARMWWLLDASDARERVARGMTERLYSLWQRSKLPADMQTANPPAALIDLVLRSARNLHYSSETPRGGAPFIERAREGDTNVVQLMVQAHTKEWTGTIGSVLGESVYRLTSGVLHGTAYGLDIHLTSPDRPAEAGADWIGKPQIVTAGRLIVPIATQAAFSYVYVVGKQAALYGWPEASLEPHRAQVLARTYDALQRTAVSEEERAAAEAQVRASGELA